ncbi:hypothetical protein [Psychrobacillus antarcticus]|uniref:hypothetical protein n=1 Tax=Psychrobacillus antarcticus TaxID=2879115 RepID=UPI0024078888|nr:hypothetical protein [Psychrobacillus antarcticus]
MEEKKPSMAISKEELAELLKNAGSTNPEEFPDSDFVWDDLDKDDCLDQSYPGVSEENYNFKGPNELLKTKMKEI